MPLATLDLLQNLRRRSRKSNRPKDDLERSSLGRSALICGPVIIQFHSHGGDLLVSGALYMHLDIGPLYSRDR
jgi:hypothetical protein